MSKSFQNLPLVITVMEPLRPHLRPQEDTICSIAAKCNTSSHTCTKYFLPPAQHFLLILTWDTLQSPHVQYSRSSEKLTPRKLTFDQGQIGRRIYPSATFSLGQTSCKLVIHTVSEGGAARLSSHVLLTPSGSWLNNAPLHWLSLLS